VFFLGFFVVGEVFGTFYTGTSCDLGYATSLSGLGASENFLPSGAGTAWPSHSEFFYLLDTDWLIILCVSSETRPSAFRGLQPREQHDRGGHRTSLLAGSGCILVSGPPGKFNREIDLPAVD
jgi:hypothetical protein